MPSYNKTGKREITMNFSLQEELYPQEWPQVRPAGCSSLLDLEHLTKKWATELPTCLIQTKLQTLKSFAKTRESC